MTPLAAEAFLLDEGSQVEMASNSPVLGRQIQERRGQEPAGGRFCSVTGLAAETERATLGTR